MNIFPCPGKRKFSILQFFNFFFLFQTFWRSLRLTNLTITMLLFPLTRWHASIESTSILQPTLSNIPTTLSSNDSSFTSLGIPTMSNHFLLEYWAFAQHWSSISTSLLEGRSLTSFKIHTSDLSLSNLSLNLRISSSNSVLKLLSSSSLFCKNKAIGIESFLYNLPNDS